MIRAAIGATLPALALSAVAAPAQAERLSPYLDDLEARIEAYADNIDSPNSREEERQLRALGLAHGALGRTPASLREELEQQADAVAALWPLYRKDPVMDSAVDQAMLLFLHRMRARAEQLGTHPESGPTPESMEAHRLAVRFRFRYGGGALSARNWKSAAKRLVRAAIELEAIADARGVGPEMSFPSGTITATVGETEVSWRIASATHSSATTEFVLDGFGLDPDNSVDWYFTTRGLMNPGSGAVYPRSDDPPVGPSYTDRGDIHVSRVIRFPTIFERNATEEYYPDRTDRDNELVITAWDPVAGTAAGTFQYRMDPTDGGPSVVVTGQFTVAGGLEVY